MWTRPFAVLVFLYGPHGLACERNTRHRTSTSATLWNFSKQVQEAGPELSTHTCPCEGSSSWSACTSGQGERCYCTACWCTTRGSATSQLSPSCSPLLPRLPMQGALDQPSDAGIGTATNIVAGRVACLGRFAAASRQCPKSWQTKALRGFRFRAHRSTTVTSAASQNRHGTDRGVVFRWAPYGIRPSVMDTIWTGASSQPQVLTHRRSDPHHDNSGIKWACPAKTCACGC